LLHHEHINGCGKRRQIGRKTVFSYVVSQARELRMYKGCANYMCTKGNVREQSGHQVTSQTSATLSSTALCTLDL